jgi:phospholipase D1/2
VINLIAGVSEIRLKDFAIGTVVGMLPGVAAIAFLADRISDSFHHPDLARFAALGMAVLLVGGGLMGLRRWVKRKRADRSSRKSASDDVQEPG